MSFDWQFPYPSRRMPVFAANMVATSQPLAAQAGLRMLMRGGNAVDAALAAAIALIVVEPTSNGLGGDAFSLIWDGNELQGFNGSGCAPEACHLERFSGKDRMPLYGWDAVTVPGVVDTWVRLSERFGKLPFENLFEPAIAYALDGFRVSPTIAGQWAVAREALRDFEEFKRTFLVNGRAPAAGERFICSDLAKTLQKIALSRGEAFYRGEIAEQMAAYAAQTGGIMSFDDLARHEGEWVSPLGIDYRDVRLHEIPPNGQGIAALIALGILRLFEPAQFAVDSADSVHLQVEAMKLGFIDAHRHVCDPNHMAVSPAELLSESRLAESAGRIDMKRAFKPAAKLPEDHGTVYLCAADESGMMVSYIQSNFHGFGSGIVIPDTGISMQNRGYGFVLEKDHPNCVGGGKRPYHTIIPAFVTDAAGSPIMAFGVMGGHMQPQGHVQMMVRMFDYGQNPQAACDAPRWHIDENFDLALESGFPTEVKQELEKRGHRFIEEPPLHLFGGGQIIRRFKNGGYAGASDPRKDGQAVGY